MQEPATDLMFNGVNGSTGEYLFQQLPAGAVARVALGEKVDPAHYRNLQQLLRLREPGHLGVMEHIDPEVLAEAGWGLIVPVGCDPQILDALQPLREHRKAEAAAINPVRYKEFTGPLAYRPGESSDAWLARQGVAPGPADPDRGVPYYLLIVAGPAEIPFRFQYHLDVQYAVGRIHFATVAEYRRYAESVVAAERRGLARPQRVALAGISNGADRSTNLSSAHLLAPLADSLSGDPRFSDWLIERIGPSDATKKRGMLDLIGGPQTPPLLFTTSHGMGFDPDDRRQLRHQGALLCQDWPGLEVWGRQPIPEDFYLSADDVGAAARVWGSIFFHFACYSAGTPREDDFSHHVLLPDRPLIAPHPFVASLPQRLLGHEAGGALAVIGHVDRAWTWSFRWQRVDSGVTVFADVMKRLMRGQRVGHALEAFNERYGQIAASLNTELEDIRFGKLYNPHDLADLWTANNDARAYVIVGDPAVRLLFASGSPADGVNRALELPALWSVAAAESPVAQPEQPASTQAALGPASTAPAEATLVAPHPADSNAAAFASADARSEFAAQPFATRSTMIVIGLYCGICNSSATMARAPKSAAWASALWSILSYTLICGPPAAATI
ncbi:MAG: hypothetical protein HC822_23735 [Oscillochloris sp.]|nr:hypothetical protein [Oscillochloris sp.]